MGSLMEKAAEPQAPAMPSAGFHLRMAAASAFLLAVTVAGCLVVSIHVQVSELLIAFFALCAVISPLAFYWHEQGRVAYREAVLVLPWEILFVITITFTVLAAARLDFPLRDELFARIDHALRVNVPAIETWADSHRLGAISNYSYDLMLPLLAAAGLLPVFTGKVTYARRFLMANLAAFAIGVPVFALLPAVGPWFFYQTRPNVAQMDCQLRLLSLRLPGPYVSSSHSAGVICFPSFHVIWAILCVSALWYLRPLRIPLVLVASAIVLSTLTTGWHYFCDVLAGIVIASISLVIASVYAS